MEVARVNLKNVQNFKKLVIKDSIRDKGGFVDVGEDEEEHKEDGRDQLKIPNFSRRVQSDSSISSDLQSDLNDD